MLGFVVGTVCLVGLVRLLRGPRRFYRGPYGAHGCGWDRRHCGGDGWRRDDDDVFAGGGEHGGGNDGMSLRGLFLRLQTTPGQERAIATALRELRASFEQASAARRRSARDLADALRGDNLSTDAMGTVFASLDEGVSQIRDGAFSALTAIHEALDPRQRRMLAELLERSGGLEDLAKIR